MGGTPSSPLAGDRERSGLATAQTLCSLLWISQRHLPPQPEPACLMSDDVQDSQEVHSNWQYLESLEERTGAEGLCQDLPVLLPAAPSIANISSTMSLSEAEVQSARGAWEKIYVDAEDNGTTVLVRMFTEHPDTKSYFTHFKGMDSAEEMTQSDQVRGHGKKVFSAINNMVQHLDSSEAFLGIVTPLGKKHATQLKIDPKNFRIICDIILQLMEEKFGGDCKASFEKVTNEICTHLNNIYKEEGW